MNRMEFLQRKKERKKISMVTCYDFWSAKLLNDTDIDCLLVGDSLAMVMHGFDSTLAADIELMALHTRAVQRGAPEKFIVADMPFLSTRKGLELAMNGVEALMKSGANAVKLEGAAGHLDLVRHIVESGVPVMGHLGLTPQSVHQLGGFKVQGKSSDCEERLATEAKSLQDAGAFSLVFECIPSSLAKTISEGLEIPVIGIGAGSEVDGQVLVLQDMLGMNSQFKPKFLRHYAQGAELLQSALQTFHQDVIERRFPSDEESY